jgi:hypothetical protein
MARSGNSVATCFTDTCARSDLHGCEIPPDLRKVRLNLAKLACGLGETFRLSLVVPEFCNLSQVKKFCSGLLDPSLRSGHPWWPTVKDCGIRTRVTIGGTVFLFRKTLPSSVPDLDSYVSLLTHPAPDPPVEFWEFSRKEVRRLFKSGWDRGYLRKVSGLTLSTSACLESSRSHGGARGLHLTSGRDRDWWISRCLGEEDINITSDVRVTTVECEGKTRIVTVSSQDMGVLKPVHDLLYDHISRKEWLLRGEAKPSSFDGFVSREGEVFVSGDYESATDNLNLDVACHILTEVMSTATHIPVNVRELAIASLRKVLICRGQSFCHRRGQLMGSLLCFPLLCLQNYLAFRFFVRRRVPLRINGDDIVFRARHCEVRRWVDGVGSIGLKMSVGKTLFESSWFSLNSSFFHANRRGVRSIPVVRSTQWFRRVECPTAIAGRVAAFAVGMRQRSEWKARLLRELRPAIDSSQRSLRRGLGVPVSREVIVRSGFWDREKFYLSLPSEPVLPLPRGSFAQRCIPEGWRRVPVERLVDSDRDLERIVMEEMCRLTWERKPLPPSEVSNALWEETRLGTFSYSSYLRWVKNCVRGSGRFFCRRCQGQGPLPSGRCSWCLFVRVGGGSTLGVSQGYSVREAVRVCQAPADSVRRVLSAGRPKLAWRPPAVGTLAQRPITFRRGGVV